MKKRFLAVIILLVVVAGCTTTMNTPTKRVEEFMSKYQGLDSDVLSQLDHVVSNDSTMSDDQKKEYTSLMKKQYQSLSYKIKDEKIEEETATVTVEVEVYDYRSALNNAETYYASNKDKFKDKDGQIDNSKYMDYKITEMKKVSDRKKYELVFTLFHEDDEWNMDDLSDNDRQKLHGVYQD